MIGPSPARVNFIDQGTIRWLCDHGSEDTFCHGATTDVSQANKKDRDTFSGHCKWIVHVFKVL